MDQKGKRVRSSLFGGLRRAAGRTSGVKTEDVATPPAPEETKRKASRATVSFSCNVWTENAEDYAEATEECKQMVREAGGNILPATYPGGFLYDLSFATGKNPLDNFDKTSGGSHISVMPYDARITPHVHPLRAHPAGTNSETKHSVLGHMNRFGLNPHSHPCNGRDKPCIASCEYRRMSSQRPISSSAQTREDIVTACVSSSPPQLDPTKRTSLIRIDDMYKLADTRVSLALTQERLESNSRSLPHIFEQNHTIGWLGHQKTVDHFAQRREDAQALQAQQDFVTRRRPRPTPIYGTVTNGQFTSGTANCMPLIPRRSSSVQASSRSQSLDVRRDSIVTAVEEECSPGLCPRAPLGSVEPYSSVSLDAPIQPPNSPRSDEGGSPMYSELGTDVIENLQKRLGDIREGFEGMF